MTKNTIKDMVKMAVDGLETKVFALHIKDGLDIDSFTSASHIIQELTHLQIELIEDVSVKRLEDMAQEVIEYRNDYNRIYLNYKRSC